MLSARVLWFLHRMPMVFVTTSVVGQDDMRMKEAALEAASIQVKAELLDDLAQIFRVFFDDFARLL
jgi:hypothetical protein